MALEDQARIQTQILQLMQSQQALMLQMNDLSAQRGISEAAVNKLIQEGNELMGQSRNIDFVKLAKVSAAQAGFKAFGNTVSMAFKVATIAAEALIDTIKTVTKVVYDVTKAILLLPFDIFDDFVSKAVSMSGSNELAQAFEEIRKQFGSFNDEIAKGVKNIATLNGKVNQFNFFKQNLLPGLSLMRVFGSFPAMIKDINETLSAMGNAVNLVLGEFKESPEILIGLQKGLGMTKEEFRSFSEYAISRGGNVKDSGLAIARMSMHMADKFGLSAKMISRDVGVMTKDVAHFGSLSERELIQVATYTAKLGIETSKLAAMMDKFLTYEDAADSVSKLSQAFNVQLSTMQMIMTDDPAQMFDDVRQSLVNAGVATDNMTRAQLKNLSTLLGMDEGTVKLGFSTKNLSKSYEEVKKEGDLAARKQTDLNDTLKRLADQIERIIPSGNLLTGGFLKSFLDGIERGIQRTPAFASMIVTLHRSLTATLFEGAKLGESLVKILGLDKIFDIIKDEFGVKKMKEFWGGVKDKTGKVVKYGVASIFEEAFVTGNFTNAFERLYNLLKEKTEAVYGRLKNPLNNLASLVGNAIKQLLLTISTYLKKGMIIFSGFLSGKDVKDIFKELGETFEDTPYEKLVMPIYEGLQGAFLNITTGLEKLLPVIFAKVIKAFTLLFKGIRYALANDEERKRLKQENYFGLSKEYDKVTGEIKSSPLAESMTRIFEGMDNVWSQLGNQLKDAFSDAMKSALYKVFTSDIVITYFKISFAAGLLQAIVTNFAAAKALQLTGGQMIPGGGGGGGGSALSGFLAAGGIVGNLTGKTPGAGTALGKIGTGISAKKIGVAALTGFALDVGKNFVDKGSAMETGMDYAATALELGSLGATLGSVILPGVGTAIGAGLGATIGLARTYLSRSEEENTKIVQSQQKMTEEVSKSISEQTKNSIDAIDNTQSRVERTLSDSLNKSAGPSAITPEMTALGGQLKLLTDNIFSLNTSILGLTAKMSTEAFTNATTVALNSSGIPSVKSSISAQGMKIKNIDVKVDKVNNNIITGFKSLESALGNMKVQMNVSIHLDAKQVEKVMVESKTSLTRKVVETLTGNLSKVDTEARDTKIADAVLGPSTR